MGAGVPDNFSHRVLVYSRTHCHSYFTLRRFQRWYDYVKTLLEIKFIAPIDIHPKSSWLQLTSCSTPYTIVCTIPSMLLLSQGYFYNILLKFGMVYCTPFEKKEPLIETCQIQLPRWFFRAWLILKSKCHGVMEPRPRASFIFYLRGMIEVLLGDVDVYYIIHCISTSHNVKCLCFFP